LGGISERRQRKRGRERDGGRGSRANRKSKQTPTVQFKGKVDSEKGMAKGGVRGRGKVHEMVPYPDRAFDEDSGERVR
jgi:hypothetical protein